MPNPFNFVTPDEEQPSETETGAENLAVDNAEFAAAVGLPPEPEATGGRRDEVQKRFRLARYYESLIDEPIFKDDPSEEALTVFQEVRDFCQGRLEALIGMGGIAAPSAAAALPPQLAELTPERIEMLVQVADRLLKKPAILEKPVVKAPVVQKVAPPRNPQVRAPAPAVRPAVASARPAPAAPKKPAAPSQKLGTATNETIEVPQKDGSKRKYRKMIDNRNGQDFWLGENGQKYMLEVSETGENYMRSIQRPSKPAPTGPQPLPALNGAAMAIVAANHARQAEQQDDVASGRARDMIAGARPR